jgi:hypothetical protein
MTQEANKFVMPSGVEDLKKLTALVMEAVRCKQEIDVQNGDIKIVKEDLKEHFDMSGGDATKFINRFYDELKFKDQIVALEEIDANAEILSKYK